MSEDAEAPDEHDDHPHNPEMLVWAVSVGPHVDGGPEYVEHR